MSIVLVLALIGAALLITGVIGLAVSHQRNVRWLESKAAQKRLTANIMRLEHQEMPPPYDHVNCHTCDTTLIQDYPDEAQYDEYEVQLMSGPVKILKTRRTVYIPDPPPMMYDPEIVGQPLDVRPAEYDYIGKPPKAIAQPEIIRR